MQVFAHRLMQVGGAWLSAARNYIQCKIPRGEYVTWGSAEPLSINVFQVEELASKATAAGINDYLSKQIKAIGKMDIDESLKEKIIKTISIEI